VRLPGVASEIRSLAALDAAWIAAIAGRDVWLSSDGETWTRCARSDGEVEGLVRTSGRRVVAATTTGVRISEDMGRSWRPVGGPLEGNTVQAICSHPAQSSILFAARFGAIYRSLDGGERWEPFSPRDWPVISVKQLMVKPGRPDRLLVLSQQQGVFAISLETQPQKSPTNGR